MDKTALLKVASDAFKEYNNIHSMTMPTGTASNEQIEAHYGRKIRKTEHNPETGMTQHYF